MELDVITEWAMVAVGLSVGLAIVVGVLCLSVWMVAQTYRGLREEDPE